ncbi:hypothetical protein FO440_01140 [Mucilaginibacter corticis]|uniref:Tetratricopeptide repeat protein n=1 Tax=Mucilaginibacter corticis TaxID=2597670 RepID=A0A556MSD6_9SPHI|nr:hypothetical protein [Mucilaginibacter corticis]TSJ42823.1 hypothetical protein FO440_01140 [Mucilaginibacter corticis]
MNEQVDYAAHEFLWKLLANPADPNYAYVSDLQSLVEKYPQSGVLRALQISNGDKRFAKQAAAYFDPAVLHKIATVPESLQLVNPERVIYYNGSVHTTATEIVAEAPVVNAAEPEQETITDAYIEQAPAEIEQDPYAYPSEESAVAHADEAQTKAEIIDDKATHETYVHETEATPLATELAETENPEANILGKEYEAYLSSKENEQAAQVIADDDDERYFHQDIDDEVYEEIVSIEDIGLEQIASLNKENTDEQAEVKEPEIKKPENESFFVFETEKAENETEEPADRYPALIAADKTWKPKSNVSRYNDEKMPYTFLWWLDKTRKEHADIYQPYVSKATPVEKKKQIVDELQKQYYQNIVNITSITDLDKTPEKPAATGHPSKEDQIIERFIQEEPHIKHPSGIKLNNENKARRSSEDKEELVTETLAKIYTEQMLYHKAILTYKKLMLKYPEKSLYFAGQIEQLESKIN